MAHSNNTKSRSNAARTKAIIIAVVAIVLIVAIAFCVLYFGFPEKWNAIMSMVRGDTPQTPQNPQNPQDTVIHEGDLQVHMFDIGQGDCILILFPDGKDMLIDCGYTSKSNEKKTSALNYLKTNVADGQLDYLMLTHCDSDHVQFMDNVLEEFQVDNVYMPNVLSSPKSTSSLKSKIDSLPDDVIARFTDEDVVDSDVYAEFFYAVFTEPNCTVTLNVDIDDTHNGIVIDNDAGYTFTFYCPTQAYYDSTRLNTAERKNAISPIGILEYNGKRMVFTGDSNELNEPLFVSRIGGHLDCDILKVGHHGSHTSSTNAFLDAITCEYCVISCNADGNTYRHPRQVTLDRFIARNMEIYRTDNNGTIVITISTEINIQVEKEVEQSVNQVGLT